MCGERDARSLGAQHRLSNEPFDHGDQSDRDPRYAATRSRRADA
jgi:hypothetical protein